MFKTKEDSISKNVEKLAATMRQSEGYLSTIKVQMHESKDYIKNITHSRSTSAEACQQSTNFLAAAKEKFSSLEAWIKLSQRNLDATLHEEEVT